MVEYLSNQKNIPIWIRIVYIPGITDKENSLEKYKDFIRNLNSVKKIEVLPYHEMGVYKWKELGVNYLLKDIRIPTKKECEKIEQFLYS